VEYDVLFACPVEYDAGEECMTSDSDCLSDTLSPFPCALIFALSNTHSQ
jgi:hypothetical protein